MNKSLITNIVSLLIIVLGYISPIFSSEIKAMGMYSFSGAITNWLAIHMLFEKVPFLYGSGVVTERFEEFKIGIRNLVMTQFFTQENLDKVLGGTTAKGSEQNTDGFTETLIDAVDFDMVFIKLKTAIMESSFGGMLNMFGGEQALEPLKPQFQIKFSEALREIINDPHFMERLSGSHSASGAHPLIDRVTQIVEARLDELTPKMVKEIIQEMIQEHLGWLVVWGGVFGAVIGLLSTVMG